jgi:hypothetical protein
MPFKAPLFTKLTIAQQGFEERTPVDPKTWQARTQRPVKYACHRTGLEETPVDTLCEETLFKVMKMQHTTKSQADGRTAVSTQGVLYRNRTTKFIQLHHSPLRWTSQFLTKNGARNLQCNS